MFPRELHNCEKPFPEGKISIRQWFFAELSPTEHRVTAFVVITAESFIGQKP